MKEAMGEESDDTSPHGTCHHHDKETLRNTAKIRHTDGLMVGVYRKVTDSALQTTEVLKQAGVTVNTEFDPPLPLCDKCTFVIRGSVAHHLHECSGRVSPSDEARLQGVLKAFSATLPDKPRRSWDSLLTQGGPENMPLEGAPMYQGVMCTSCPGQACGAESTLRRHHPGHPLVPVSYQRYSRQPYTRVEGRAWNTNIQVSGLC